MNEEQVLELFFDSKGEVVEGRSGDKKVIWKDILREGKFPVTPGRKRKIPFQVNPNGSSSVTKDLITISMSELMAGYDGKAFESVTIPLRHPKPGDEDDVLNNTGFVEGLRVVKKDDKHYLQAGLGFTEPDIAGKVRRGTIPNVSSGVFFNYHNKAQDRTYGTALNHVCLTKHPIMDDLAPFERVYASDDAIDDGQFEIEVVELADDEGDDDSNDAKIIWNEQMSTRWVIGEVRAQLSPEQPEVEGVPSMPRPYYEVIDISREDTALVEEWFKGDRKRWVIPFDIGDNKVTIAPATRWVEVREAMIAASDDFEGKTYSVLLGKLTTELQDMLGDVGEKFAVQNISTDGRVAVKDTSNGAVFLAAYIEAADSVLLSATSDWERLRAPDPVQKQPPKPKKVVPLYDTTTPEGKVAAARQQRRLLLSR